MKVFPPRSKWRWLALLAVTGVCRELQAQQLYLPSNEPEMFRLNVTEAGIGLYTEGTYEQDTFKNSGTSVSNGRFFIGPDLTLGLDGSIYHPNLFSFQLNGEGAIGRGWESVSTSSTNLLHHDFQFLGHYLFNADLFANKPLHANVFSSYSHSYRDYDFFNRATVDTWRNGASLTYQSDPFYVNAGYTHRDENTIGAGINSILSEDTFSVAARHDREQGGTSFNYTFDRYTRSDFGIAANGDNHNVAVADNERFGDRDQFRLNSQFAYNNLQSTLADNNQITAGTSLQTEHRDNLNSTVNLDYDRYQDGDFNANTLIGRAQLQHQLYQSLTSTLIAEGSDAEVSDAFTSGYTRRYGAGFSENYSKQLGAEHHLQINNSFLLEHVDQNSAGEVKGERHSFVGGTGGPVDTCFLNMPNVILSSIVVYDAGRTRVFSENLDYIVIPNGAITSIQRVAGSTLPDSIVIDYRTTPSPSGSYEALTDYVEVRFDLFENLWGIYARAGFSLNNAARDLLVPNLRTYAFGTDVNWRWLRAGIEYDIFDSDFSRYNSTTLFQTLTFRPDVSSTLSFTFSESWVDYVNIQAQQAYYRFISRYHYTFTGHLALDLEGGFEYNHGLGVDQTLATIRPGIEYTIGRSSLKAGYNFEYDLFLNNEQRQQHMLFAQFRRMF